MCLKQYDVLIMAFVAYELFLLRLKLEYAAAQCNSYPTYP